MGGVGGSLGGHLRFKCSVKNRAGSANAPEGVLRENNFRVPVGCGPTEQGVAQEDFEEAFVI